MGDRQDDDENHRIIGLRNLAKASAAQKCHSVIIAKKTIGSYEIEKYTKCNHLVFQCYCHHDCKKSHFLPS